MYYSRLWCPHIWGLMDQSVMRCIISFCLFCTFKVLPFTTIPIWPINKYRGIIVPETSLKIWGLRKSSMIWKHPHYIRRWYCLKCHRLPQCADAGYHLSLGRVMKAYLSSRWRTQQNLSTGLQQLQGTVSGLDQSRDRDNLLQDHYNTFSMPLRFPFQPHDGDQVCILCLHSVDYSAVLHRL